MLTPRDVEALEEYVREELTATIAGAAKRKSRDHLALTGAEVAAFLAIQVVMPIVANFVSSVMYDKYQSVRTKKDAEAARADLVAALAARPSPTQVVAESQVLDEIENTLASNGVQREQARAIAITTYERVRKLATSE